MSAGGGPEGGARARGGPVPGGSTRPRDPSAAGWKGLLALLCLAISLLLWINGLLASLDRPSVGDDLTRRQLELAVLAAPELPQPLGEALAGSDPEVTLQEHLLQEIERRQEAGQPAAADLLLERALLLRRQQDRRQGDALLEQVRARPDDDPHSSAAERQLARDLLAAPALDTAAARPLLSPAEARAQAAALGRGPLLEQLSCAALAGSPEPCGAAPAARRAARQLLVVNLLPALILLLGLGLLVRQLWLRWRQGPLPVAPLQGPLLSGVDVVLLVAGGFVVVGELLTPVLLTPLVQRGLLLLGLTGPLRDGVTVVALYLGLMAGPLVILTLMLRGLGSGPAGGWLQFRWVPLGVTARRAFVGFLMVLPLVSVVGWLQAQLWSDAGGSNPLLELVLKSQNLPALACFAFTAILLAPLFEETIFRGVLLPVAARELGGAWGVVVSAAVFAVAHLSLGELPALFVLGLGLGWLRLSSGRLGASVLMHALWNAMTFSNLVLLGS
ncbi:type II CAAX prenyl endopeptidase Rce1 family protein [Vulcanococcus limneticus]|uniref:CPBP family glutamic-type intramembrane protease n=1 Tax=Vulcanococcus limneticus TaxID=2170428 RepID=UPI00398C234B